MQMAQILILGGRDAIGLRLHRGKPFLIVEQSFFRVPRVEKVLLSGAFGIKSCFLSLLKDKKRHRPVFFRWMALLPLVVIVCYCNLTNL